MHFAASVLLAILASSARAPDQGRIQARNEISAYLDKATLEVPGTVEQRPFVLSGGTARSGFLLHPTASAANTVLHVPEIDVPRATARDEAVMLLFYIGMQDEIPWGATENTPNGARFSVEVNGENVFEEAIDDPGWRLCAVDLARWQGQRARLSFAVNSIDGNANYDWAHFAEARLAIVGLVPDVAGLGTLSESPGVAFAWVKADSGAKVAGRCGDGTRTRQVSAGTSILAIPYGVPGGLQVDIVDGAATVARTGFAAWNARIKLVSFHTRPRIILDGEPFDVIFHYRNLGPGHIAGSPGISAYGLKWLDADGPREEPCLPPSQAAESVSQLWRPGEERTFTWRAAGVSHKNSNGPDCSATASMWGSPTGKVFPTVYGSTEQKDFPYSMAPTLAPYLIDGVLGLPSTPFRFGLRKGTHDAAIEIRKDGHTIATMPLAGKVRFDSGSLFNINGSIDPQPGLAETIDGWCGFNLPKSDFKGIKEASTIPGGVQFSLDAKHPGYYFAEATTLGGSGRVHLRFRHLIAPGSPLEHALNGTHYVIGPTINFGDRNPGAAREFAIFPGLEFLEGPEGASSERDLAPPHHDRGYPEIYKVTAPLMAAAGSGSMMGVMWDPAQLARVAPDTKLARFDAPGHDPAFAMMKVLLPLRVDLMKDEVSADTWIVMQDETIFSASARGQDTSRAAFVLDMYRHYFEAFGMPNPSPQPRAWDEERALCAEAYLNAAGSADPPGFRHCAGWDVSAFAAHAVPARLLLREGLPGEAQAALSARVDAVVAHALAEEGPAALTSSAGAHIVNGEAPFFEGHVGEALVTMREQAFRKLEKREDGLWRWQPATPRHALLGKAGDHTLGQAAFGARMVLRAARLTGHLELRRQALDCLEPMEQYAVPRGAQTWECPLYQPDLLAAAHAIAAYMDAYHLTGDRHYITQAAYWAKTGLPFVYFWSPTGHPAMLYNTIPVFGSTWFTHSWIGVPVVWCGLVYAYALQDLAPYDNSFDWRTIAQGITNSAMHQQYTDGPSKGCYPDSWNVLTATPNPADINPENIVLNECRLRGNGAEIRTQRVPARVGEALVNSIFDITLVAGEAGTDRLGIWLAGTPGFPGYTAVAPAQEPLAVDGAGPRAADSAALARLPQGWLYHRESQALVFKNTPAAREFKIEVTW